jgi:nitrate/nitrite transporter NarK
MRDSKYRWVIFFVCFLILFAMVGVAVAPFSLYIVPVTEHFGFSRGDFTIIFSIKTVVGVIIQLSLWSIIKQFGLRWVMVIGSLVVPMGFFFFAQATTLWMFYLGGLFRWDWFFPDVYYANNTVD